MSFWYFLVEYGTLIFLGVLTWLGTSKIYFTNFIDNSGSHLKILNDFLQKWGSLINFTAMLVGIISILPLIIDYFSEKHKVCGVPKGLNVRANYGMDSEKVSSALNGDEVSLISEVKYDSDGNPWIKVSGKGIHGWVAKEFICTEN